MKIPYINNVSQITSGAVTGTSDNPNSISVYPCGIAITYMRILCTQTLDFRLVQDGRVIFPAHVVEPGGYVKLPGATTTTYEIFGLWIPVKLTLPVTAEFYATSGVFNLIMVMASEDVRSTLEETLGKLIETMKTLRGEK